MLYSPVPNSCRCPIVDGSWPYGFVRLSQTVDLRRIVFMCVYDFMYIFPSFFLRERSELQHVAFILMAPCIFFRGGTVHTRLTRRIELPCSSSFRKSKTRRQQLSSPPCFVYVEKQQLLREMFCTFQKNHMQYGSQTLERST